MPGLLLVYSEPGSTPLCLPLPSFHSWSHWVALDSTQPSHLALYDIDSPDTINDIPYASFTTRDHAMLAQLALVDRRAYVLHEPEHPPAAGAEYSSASPGPFLTSVTMDIPAEHVADFNRWYDEEHILDIAKTPGWVRTRGFVFAAAPEVLGTEENLRKSAEGPQKFLALHEWESPAALGTEEFKAAISTPLTLKFKGLVTCSERRLFKLHKAWRE